MSETTVNIIIILILLVIAGVAVGYIIREKKRGTKCIGCPYAKECAARNRKDCSGQK